MEGENGGIASVSNSYSVCPQKAVIGNFHSKSLALMKEGSILMSEI